MLKNILNLNGAQELSKNEQKSVIGGGPFCPTGQYPSSGLCEANCRGGDGGGAGNGTCAHIISTGCWVCISNWK